MNGLLHCFPGTLETKATVFQHLKPFLDENEGVVFGSTILGHGVKHGRLARKALQLYNSEGIFTNLEDDLSGLEHALANEFSDHHVETRGSFALFVARR